MLATLWVKTKIATFALCVRTKIATFALCVKTNIVTLFFVFFMLEENSNSFFFLSVTIRQQLRFPVNKYRNWILSGIGQKAFFFFQSKIANLVFLFCFQNERSYPLLLLLFFLCVGGNIAPLGFYATPNIGTLALRATNIATLNILSRVRTNCTHAIK